MTWKDCTFEEAMKFAMEDEVIDHHPLITESPYPDAEVVYFESGFAIACFHGEVRGVTPDIDSEPSQWFIGEP